MEKEKNYYFGEDCPVGMVQVEFVGSDPKKKISDYGWKPEKSTFLEIYVDGKRFRIDVGDIGEGKRGLHIITGSEIEYEQTASNSCNILIKGSAKC